MKTPEELAEELDRQAVLYVSLKARNDVSYYVGMDCYKAGYQAAAPQWISVKDRLPEINNRMSEDVLILDEYGQMSVKPFEIVNNKIVVDWGEAGTRPLSDFTHWMPLPEPPEE
jgi:hypothetical protein